MRCPLNCSSLESVLPRGIWGRGSHREPGTCSKVSRQNLEARLTVAAGVCRTVLNRVTQKDRAEY